MTPPPRRVFVLGATGTIGRATVRALVRRGYTVVCLVRARGANSSTRTPESVADAYGLPGAIIRIGDVQDPASLERDGFRGEQFDVVVSCLASRTGVPRDAWAVDYQANVNALEAARRASVSHMVLLSAICVQKPKLAFQHAKLKFEKQLMESGLCYSIVRPTAFFKSLSGQVERVRRGKPFLVFGDGTLTACKPISDADLADYIADCLDRPERYNRILPIGGPGEAITPRQQGEALFAMLGRPARFTHVPVRMLDVIIAVLGAVGRIVPAVADKAELAKIGRYYATESMLVFDAARGVYDADATPTAGTQTLREFYADLLRGAATVDRGEHAVF